MAADKLSGAFCFVHNEEMYTEVEVDVAFNHSALLFNTTLPNALSYGIRYTAERAEHFT